MKNINNVWNAIVYLMDDDIREELHNKLAPTTNEIFLTEYLNRDPSFYDLLKSEFGIDFA